MSKLIIRLKPETSIMAGKTKIKNIAMTDALLLFEGDEKYSDRFKDPTTVPENLPPG